MMQNRLNETVIDTRLDACVRAAQGGDVDQARKLHEMLDAMLIERETPEGRFWLTDHGRMLLAGMHRELGACEGTGHQLSEAVLDAVRLKPHPAHWDDTCSFIRDLRLAITVANEMCEQRESGGATDLDSAVEAVASGGEFGPDAGQIRKTYEEIASTVSGFKEIAHC
jgi:hypothetical protein